MLYVIFKASFVDS